MNNSSFFEVSAFFLFWGKYHAKVSKLNKRGGCLLKEMGHSETPLIGLKELPYFLKEHINSYENTLYHKFNETIGSV